MKKNLLQITLKWGFILGLALSAIQFLRIFSDLEYFATIGRILDLMQFVAFIGILLLGMKEYRDETLGGRIKFPRAFLSGALMAIVAFVVVILYLTIHYDYIDKEAIPKLNERNRVRYSEKMKTTPVTEEELTDYIHRVENSLHATVSDVQTQECDAVVKENLSVLGKYYALRMQNRAVADSSVYQLKNFDQYAQRQLLDLTKQILTQQEEDTACHQAFIQTVQTTIRQLQQETLFDKHYRENINQLPLYTNTFATALYFSVSILVFGLLFAIFVALYVYRGKKE